MPASDAVPPQDHPPARVLFIGNSHTYYHDMPDTVKLLARAAQPPADMVWEGVFAGGSTLERHWHAGEAKEAIDRGGWKAVVLQEQSTRPVEDPQAMAEYVRRFHEAAVAAGAQTVLYATWPRRGRPYDLDAIAGGYESLACELSARLAPAGRAWALAQQERPHIELYDTDGRHASPLGSYLAACTLVWALFGRDPRACGEAQVPGVRFDEATFLLEVAFRATAQASG